jgi:hypothetical protein
MWLEMVEMFSDPIEGIVVLASQQSPLLGFDSTNLLPLVAGAT